MRNCCFIFLSQKLLKRKFTYLYNKAINCRHSAKPQNVTRKPNDYPPYEENHFILTSLRIPAQNENCENKQIKVVSEHSVKSRYFFFRKTSFEKHKRVDKVIDNDGKVLVECTMKSKQDHDQFFIKKFQRIIITNNQIHEVKFKYKDEFGSLKIYNKCGELIETKKLKTEELDETYNFNAVIL